MKSRGKDKQPRRMAAASLENLKPLERVRPPGCEVVEVKVYLVPHDAKAWRRLTPTERGQLVRLALEMRDNGQQFTGAL